MLRPRACRRKHFLARSSITRYPPDVPPIIERLCWATDLHLNFADPFPLFISMVRALNPDGLVLTGDLTEAPFLREHLAKLDDCLWLPTWIILGNHDFYHGSIAHVRLTAAELCKRSRWLHYLPNCSPVDLGADTMLVGHEGWADGRLGDYTHSNVTLNDYIRIRDLAGLEHRTVRLAKLHELGDEAAAFLKPKLASALTKARRVVVATHVPPFAAACWHKGKTSNADFLPHFTCAAMGDMLFEAARTHPQNEILVLCGHTHSAGRAEILPNLVVHTGAAIYGSPEPCGTIATRSLEFTSLPSAMEHDS